MTAPPIEIRDLHKYFGELEVLRGISTTIQTGEVVCLLAMIGLFALLDNWSTDY